MNENVNTSLLLLAFWISFLVALWVLLLEFAWEFTNYRTRTKNQGSHLSTLDIFCFFSDVFSIFGGKACIEMHRVYIPKTFSLWVMQPFQKSETYGTLSWQTHTSCWLIYDAISFFLQCWSRMQNHLVLLSFGCSVHKTTSFPQRNLSIIRYNYSFL